MHSFTVCAQRVLLKFNLTVSQVQMIIWLLFRGAWARSPEQKKYKTCLAMCDYIKRINTISLHTWQTSARSTSAATSSSRRTVRTPTTSSPRSRSTAPSTVSPRPLRPTKAATRATAAACDTAARVRRAHGARALLKSILARFVAHEARTCTDNRTHAHMLSTLVAFSLLLLTIFFFLISVIGDHLKRFGCRDLNFGETACCIMLPAPSIIVACAICIPVYPAIALPSSLFRLSQAPPSTHHSFEHAKRLNRWHKNVR